MHYRKNRLGYLLEGWRPPAGVRKSHPRDVTYTKAGWVVWGAFWLCLAGGFAALVGLGAKADREAGQARLLQTEGVETAGWITRLWRGSGDSKQPWVAYEFEVAGQKYTGRSKVRLSAWRMLQLGGEWRIRYARSNPRIHHPAHIAPSQTPIFVPYLVGGLCLAIALVPAALLRSQRHLLAEGRLAPGIVTEVKNKHSQHGQRYVTTFEFPLLSGGVGKGHTIPEKQNHFVGQRVCVVYLPDEPSKNAIYPVGLVKQAGIFPQEERPAKVVRRAPMRTRRAMA
ncbi:MAG: hypothetical protein JST93_32875 [Acidobacteria bacterium]|nr:hypothetical protein [Acidobacteriota bacterium]